MYSNKYTKEVSLLYFALTSPFFIGPKFSTHNNFRRFFDASDKKGKESVFNVTGCKHL